MPKRDSVDVKDQVVVNPIRMGKKGFVFDIFAIISYVKSWIRRMQGQDVFCPLDQALLTELVSRLSGVTRAIVETQIAEVNYTDSVHYGNKSETIMHNVRPFGAYLYASKMFSFESEEVILATAKFRCLGLIYSVDFVVVLNRLSMLVYNRSTREASKETGVEILGFDLDAVPIDQFGRAKRD